MQAVERCRDLTETNGAWLACFSNAPPTPVSNPFLNAEAGTAMVFRVRVGR